MVKRKKRTIDAGIPWYRDISLSNKEILVGAVCLSCGEIIGKEFSDSNSRRRKRHISCQKEHRRKTQLASQQKRNPPIYKTKKKYCIDCGKELPKTKVSSKIAKRCDWCQFLYNKKKSKTYTRKDRDVTVGVGCIRCNEFTPAKNSNKKYCNTCKELHRKYKSDVASQDEKYYTAKEYMNKNGRIKKSNNTGTYDTSPSHVGNVEHKKKDWEQEEKAVNMIKKETFKNSKYNCQYTMNEGDYIRGIAYKEKKKSEE